MIQVRCFGYLYDCIQYKQTVIPKNINPRDVPKIPISGNLLSLISSQVTCAPMIDIITPIVNGATSPPIRAAAHVKSAVDTAIAIAALITPAFSAVISTIMPTNNTNIKAINIAIYLPTLARDLLFSQDMIIFKHHLPTTQHVQFRACLFDTFPWQDWYRGVPLGLRTVEVPYAYQDQQ